MKKISVTLDNLTLGDLEKLDGNSFVEMMEVFDNCVVIHDVAEEDQKDALRKLNWKRLAEIGDAIKTAIDIETNPKTDGKN
jgi:hypothetical protein